MSSGLRNLRVAAGLPGQQVADFVVPRNGRRWLVGFSHHECRAPSRTSKHRLLSDVRLRSRHFDLRGRNNPQATCQTSSWNATSILVG